MRSWCPTGSVPNLVDSSPRAELVWKGAVARVVPRSPALLDPPKQLGLGPQVGKDDLSHRLASRRSLPDLRRSTAVRRADHPTPDRPAPTPQARSVRRGATTTTIRGGA